MKKVVFFKLYLNQGQNGFVLLFAILLFLIIMIFTLSFFYLQFLEVDLLAHETENLQAFYLAEAGLEQGIMIFNQGQRRRRLMHELLAHSIFEDPCQRTNRDLSPNRQGTFYSVYRYEGDNNTGIVTITGIGIVNGNYNERREVESRFSWQSRGFQPAGDWPGERFGEIVHALGHTVVMSELKQKLEEVIWFIRKDENNQFADISKDQSKITLYNELTPEQQTAYRNFANNTKTDIAQARIIDKNDNELLFPEESRDHYNSPYLDEINPTTLQMLYGKDKICPFEYTENRSSQGGRTSINFSSLTIKSNKLVTLEGGLYFFESLTLEKDSILNTNGDVQIYVKNLELKENARLMGGTNTDPDHASPNDLVILAQYWDGAYYSLKEDGVTIGPAAKIAGHIFAPNLKVRLSRGSKLRETRVYGSILTHQIVTYIEPGRQAEYGPIQIIYEEYINEVTDPLEGSWREVRNP